MKRHHILGRLVFAALIAVVAAALAGCRAGNDYSRQAPADGSASLPASIALTPTQPRTSVIQPEPEFFAPPVAAGTVMAGRTVILDAGHGGHDTGARHFGMQEKDINLDVTLRTASLLRAHGCNVVLTRQSDQFVALAERSAVANRHPNAVFVSIHTNATEGDPWVTGIETFVLSSGQSDRERGQTAAGRFRAKGMDEAQGRQALATLALESSSRGPALASSLQRSLCGRLGETDRGVKKKDLAVLRETYFGPAALVEVGFMTNPRSAQRMRTDDWRQQTAEAIADGIGDFLGRM